MKRTLLLSLFLLVSVSFSASVMAGDDVCDSHYRAERRESKKAPMRRKDFKMLRECLDELSFSKEKIVLIKVACISSFFTVEQCCDLLQAFSFESDRLKALELVVPRITDIGNSWKLLEEFEFMSGKEKAADIIERCSR